MKQFIEPTINVCPIEISDILTTSTDLIYWDLYGDEAEQTE